MYVLYVIVHVKSSHVSCMGCDKKCNQFVSFICSAMLGFAGVVHYGARREDDTYITTLSIRGRNSMDAYLNQCLPEVAARPTSTLA